MEKSIIDIFKAKLAHNEFEVLSSFIFKETGIKMPGEKKIMLQSRLQKRLRSLNMDNFKEYIDYVFNQKLAHDEMIHLIDVVTTNKTDFFREPGHFDFLSREILPLYCLNEQRNIKIWTAGCSSGEEPYTLAIVLKEFIQKHRVQNMDFQILGTDISTDVLRRAVDAIYNAKSVEAIPLEIKSRYFMKSIDRINPTVRIVPEIRQKVVFKRLNFMDAYYNIVEDFDLVFCRNVLIYFNRSTQEKVIRKLCNHLKPGGCFFLGHSESIIGMDLPLEQIKPTIFRKRR